MSDQQILDNAPRGATHYSPFRNAYYKLVDCVLAHSQVDCVLYEPGLKPGTWDLSADSINLTKWLNLVELELSCQKIDWNDGYWVEGLDRAYTLTVIFEQLLGNKVNGYHPAIVRAGLQQECDAVSLQIADLYTSIGAATPD